MAWLAVAFFLVGARTVFAQGADDAIAPGTFVREVVAVEERLDDGVTTLEVRLSGKRFATLDLGGEKLVVRVDRLVPCGGRQAPRVFRSEAKIAVYGRPMTNRWQAAGGAALYTPRVTPHAAIVVGEGFEVPEVLSEAARETYGDDGRWFPGDVELWGVQPGTGVVTDEVLWVRTGGASNAVPIDGRDVALVTQLVSLEQARKLLRRGAVCDVKAKVIATEPVDRRGRPVTAEDAGRGRPATHTRLQLEVQKLVVRDPKAGRIYALIGQEGEAW